jgi:hypothetical protein
MEAVVADFKIIYLHLPRGAEEGHGKPQSVCGPVDIRNANFPNRSQKRYRLSHRGGSEHKI